MEYQSLFKNSFECHQRLIDILVEARNVDGYSLITQHEIAARVNRSQTWVTNAIKRLNTEEMCIETITEGVYRVYFEDLSSRGVFSKILVLIADTCLNPSLIQKKDSEIAKDYGYNIRTIQMYKAYLRTGWKHPASNE